MSAQEVAQQSPIAVAVQPSYKIILMGDSASGKSKLVERFLANTFVTIQASTYGVAIYKYQDQHGTGEIWDTAGQDRFASLHPSYFADAHCAICVFDVTRKTTYQHLDTWYAELQQHRPGLPTIIAANKIDADPSAANKAFAFPKKHDHCVPNIYFVSAADGTNVVKLFKDAIKFGLRYKANPHDDDFSLAVSETLSYFSQQETSTTS